MGIAEEEPNETIEEPVLDEQEPEALADGEESLEATEDVIVLAGEESQTSTSEAPKGFRRRINKLNSRLDDRDQEIDKLQRENELLKQTGQLSRVPASVVNQMPIPPTQEECGYDEQVFAQKMNEYHRNQAAYNQRMIEAAIDQRENGLKREQYQRKLNDSVDSHFDRADKLNVSDYATVQDQVVDVLGEDLVKEIISRCPKNSEMVLYHIGKNPDKLYNLKRLAKEDPTELTMMIGELRTGLKLEKRKSDAPAPETKIEGGAPKSASQYTRKLEEARELAAQTGDMSQLLAIRREAEAAGVNLR